MKYLLIYRFGKMVLIGLMLEKMQQCTEKVFIFSNQKKKKKGGTL